jgi:hypothetical protein
MKSLFWPHTHDQRCNWYTRTPDTRTSSQDCAGSDLDQYCQETRVSSSEEGWSED